MPSPAVRGVRECVLADEPVALALMGKETHAHRGRRHGAQGRHRLRHDHLRRGRGDGQIEDLSGRRPVAVICGDLDMLAADLANDGSPLNESGEFVIPGFAKMSVVHKPATEARSGVNPFTKEPMEFAAKPASKSVKASPLKVAKAMEISANTVFYDMVLNYVKPKRVADAAKEAGIQVAP